MTMSHGTGSFIIIFYGSEGCVSLVEDLNITRTLEFGLQYDTMIVTSAVLNNPKGISFFFLNWGYSISTLPPPIPLLLFIFQIPFTRNDLHCPFFETM
jgi:hypothetical protein